MLYDGIDGQLICAFALRTDGAAGPSGLNAAPWRQLCTSFNSASSYLCDSVAAVARCLCTTPVDAVGVTALAVLHLTALDKCPCVHPFGIVRRIIYRAIPITISDQIQEAAEPIQVWAGHIAGCESDVHTMCRAFESSDSNAALAC